MTQETRPWYRRWTWKRLIVRSLLAAALLVVLLLGGVYWLLRSSLPQLDGELRVEGLSDEVIVTRDALGTPSIVAKSREDAAQALGVLHAQDRFFQMDLLRRVPSGRLSELLGEAPFEFDAGMRRHRFSEMVEKSVELMPEEHQRVLNAYVRGVNQGLDSLVTAPPEYQLLRQKPQPWEAKDSLLVLLAMIHQLEPVDGTPKLAWTELRERVPDEVFDFLVRKGSEWDVPLDGSQFPKPPIPPAEVWSLRDDETQPAASESGNSKEAWNIPGSRARDQLEQVLPLVSLQPGDPQLDVGSNSWAISGAVGASGHAILANDMHLGLRVPVTWYRAVITCPMLDGNQRTLVGATLPGLPLLAVGSNGLVAWGVTSAHTAIGDLVELRPVDGQLMQYMTSDGPAELESYTAEISIAGKDPRTTEFRWSKWGPVVFEENGRRFVYRCIIHDPRVVGLNTIAIETASSVDETLQAASAAGTPRLNFIAADTSGNIGWTIAGRLPKRTTPVSPTAVDWSVRDANWDELLTADQYPQLLNPESGRIWNANDRSMGQAYLDVLGYGDSAFGARSKQIRDRLFEKETIDEQGMLAIQLDDEAIYLQYWQKLLSEVAVLDSQPLSKPAIEAVNNWGGRAAVDSVGYRLVSAFRSSVFDLIFGFLPVREGRAAPEGSLADRLELSVDWIDLKYDDVTLDLLNERPIHWLPSHFSSWDELLAEAARIAEKKLTADQPLEQATWGLANTARIQHPMSQALPMLSGWLDMPAVQLPGDRNMPRVQGPNFGASQRMVVSPGREEFGYYHQPGGASGHFLSPFYRAGFDDWAAGKASPLMPGETVHTLRLVP